MAKPRSRPAHAPGPTFLAYTPNGRKLITVGSNSVIRIFQHGSDDEPAIIDTSSDNHLAVAATNDFFIVGGEDGAVTKYSLATNSMDQILTTNSLPVRDLAISKDGEWVAVASDELDVKVVNTSDMTRVIYLREQTRGVKHVSFDVSGTVLAVSCADGMVSMYSLSSEQPQVIKSFVGLVKRLETDAEGSGKVIWHPDGRAFGVATASRDFQTVRRSDWERQRSFSGGHRADISAAAWSPNGALLVTAGVDKSLVLWETRSQKVLKSFDDIQNTVLAVAWHPTDNVVSYTNSWGELFMHTNFAPGEHAKHLRVALQPAPMIGDAVRETEQHQTNGTRTNGFHRDTEDDYLDELLGPDTMSEDGAGFIEDDDGAGYAEDVNPYGKRSAGASNGPPPKRQASYPAWHPQIHEAFQPGSTPWKGDRRYLCLNLTGFVWTVNQSTHHTLTVEFFDRHEHRDFHFTDPYKYDKACLNEKGTLLSCPPSSQSDHRAVLFYRPHETWTTRTDWRTPLPAGEKVTSMSLSESCIVATTTAGYVRVYSLFGVPLKVYRQKSTPAVTCASFRDYVMTVGNGPVGGDGITRLLYTIENVKRDEVCQSEDILALPEGVKLRSVFFSHQGDPCIYDTDGVLLVLLHWRTPGQARWVPTLDTKNLERLASGNKEESYWPVAVVDGRFHCIILKGGEEYPYFPRPLLTDFEFNIPISTPDEDEDPEVKHQKKLEEDFVRHGLHHSLKQDLVENTNATSAQKAEVDALEREVDKSLLQLLASACREGEAYGMKALELATLIRDRSGRMLEAAGKIAARFQRDILGEKITQLAERRLVGLVDEDDV